MKLSVILPCYNTAKYLSKCLDSIFNNNVENAEIILVNDGSTDNFVDVVRDFFCLDELHDKNFFEFKNAKVIVIQQPNGGVSAARNRGMDYASGDYVTFIDPDDYISDKYFVSLYNFIKSERIDVVICGYYQVLMKDDFSSECVKILPKKKYSYTKNSQIVSDILPRYLGYSVFDLQQYAKGKSLFADKEATSACRCVYNRDFLIDNNIKFKEYIRYNEDGLFNMNCFAVANRVETIMESFYYYTWWPTGAYTNRRGEYLISNKIALVNERDSIVKMLNSNKDDYSVGDESFVGNNILSIIEIMRFSHLKKAKEVLSYVNHPTVEKSVKLMPYIGKAKFDIPLFLLKCRMPMLLFCFIRCLLKLGIPLNI